MISFAPHTERLRQQRRQRIANLCELISEGISIKDAAKVMGISQASATSMMAQVRAELGWQAS